MGITNPGVFNLDSAELIDIPERRSVQGSVITYRFAVSANLIEKHHYELSHQQWIPKLEIDVLSTLSWIRRVLPRFQMLADNPASRCILALLYLCKGDAYSGAGAAWLFNGMESLLSCNPGENRAALVRRSRALSNLDERQAEQLNKTIKTLYDLRSAFVHGGIATIHPTRDETLDKRVNEEIVRVMRALDTGITLFIALLRQVINKGLDWPLFEEKLST